MPPPNVSPPTPVVEMKPLGVASPKACVAWSTSPQVQPPSTRAVRATGSTRIPFMPDRSITRPSSQAPRPGPLCPPPRTANVSCQDFAQKGPCLTLAQDDLDVTVGQQWAKATAHVASPGMCSSQADTLYSLVRQLDAPWDGPDFSDQPHDSILAQPGCILGEPLPCPEQHM